MQALFPHLLRLQALFSEIQEYHKFFSLWQDTKILRDQRIKEIE